MENKKIIYIKIILCTDSWKAGNVSFPCKFESNKKLIMYSIVWDRTETLKKIYQLDYNYLDTEK